MKRIWVFGKVYDLESLPIADIEKDIEKRIYEYIPYNIGVRITIQNKNEIEIVYHRGLNVEVGNDEIIEQDSWLISGEGYKGFVPAHSTTSGFGHTISAYYFIDKNDFYDAYKKNASFYGANRVKHVEIDNYPNMLVLKIKC